MNISKERLEKIVSWREKYGADHCVVMPAAEAEEMARYTLELQKQEPAAVLERRNDGTDRLIVDTIPPGRYELFLAPPLTSAERERLAAYDRAAKEPVAWRCMKNGPSNYVVTLSKIVAEDWISRGWPIAPLYAAPQIPATPNEDTPAATVLSSRTGNATSTIDRALPAGTKLFSAPQLPAASDDADPRDEFEKLFPMPKDVKRRGTGYCASDIPEYNAWNAQTFIDQWDGWRACRSAMLQSVGDSEQVNAPAVSFYRDGIVAAAQWVEKKREAYDNENGLHDPDTGTFEFGNDAQQEYSETLRDIEEGIRALHPNAGSNSPVIPEGWALVPIEPTLEMIKEGLKSRQNSAFETARGTYKNMLAAAPQPVKGNKEER